MMRKNTKRQDRERTSYAQRRRWRLARPAAAKPSPSNVREAGSGIAVAPPTVAVNVAGVVPLLNTSCPPLVRTGVVVHWRREPVPATGPIEVSML